jgi:antitoxin MazE
VRIPKNIAAEANVEDGDAVDVSVENGAIVVRATVKRYTIEELVADMSPDDSHAATDWGPPVAKEVW